MLAFRQRAVFGPVVGAFPLVDRAERDRIAAIVRRDHGASLDGIRQRWHRLGCVFFLHGFGHVLGGAVAVHAEHAFVPDHQHAHDLAVDALGLRFQTELRDGVAVRHVGLVVRVVAADGVPVRHDAVHDPLLRFGQVVGGSDDDIVPGLVATHLPQAA